MQESYELESIEQLHAVADILRIRIIDLLQGQPMTVTQLGDSLGMAPAKVHYHVRELEKVGLLRLVETREKSGILEKYYQPIAKDFSVSKNLFLAAPPDESLAATSAWLDQMKDGFQRAFRSALEQKNEQPDLCIGFSHIFVTADEQKLLYKQIAELLKAYEVRRTIEGEKAMMIAVVGYPQSTPAEEFTRSDIVTVPMENNWIVGVAHFDRERLEKSLAEGKRLDIHVTGICQFDHDVSPELAERAVERIHLIGKLQASPEVCEVLMKKRA